MNLGQPPVPQSKYHPFNLEEFQSMKADLEGIKSFLPSHLMGIFWTRCQAIKGTHENQPCGCPSAAKHWGSCVETISEFVKRIDGQE